MHEAASTVPEDRFCDLVMKGGITSGVVYPRAVVELAKHYRFKNIGGTSAGAIAAVCTAAAEYQRRQPGASMAGFEALHKISDELVEPGNLFNLFQPAPSCRSLFRILQAALNAGGPVLRALRVLFGLMWAYPLVMLLAALAGGIAFVPTHSYIAAVAVAALFWLVAVVIRVLVDLSIALVRNGYGLCPGTTQPRGWFARMFGGSHAHEALTPWLHRHIQRLAGRAESDNPLTFGDLWSAPGFPEWLKPHMPAGAPQKGIDLQLFTTNLAHGRPYLLPLGDSERLFYSQGEMARYMPPAIMKWLDSCHQGRKSDDGETGEEEVAGGPRDLRRLPAADKFPLVLAARMSLSFPVLFSTIPLWILDTRPDIGLKGKDAAARMTRCLFSDGGISSNFPVHLFDGMLPAWPTFGIQLEPAVRSGSKRMAKESMVKLPQSYEEGMHEIWQRFDSAPGGFSRFSGFLGAILNTMQNWNDNGLCRMPGVRDRVVRVGLYDDEGGLNLNMPTELIAAVADRGEAAAAKLVNSYAPGANGKPGLGWDHQRWIRLGVTMTMLNKRFAGMAGTLSAANPHATPFEDLVRRAGGAQLPGQPLPGMDGHFTDEQIAAVAKLLDQMRKWKIEPSLNPAPKSASFQARPEPDLRIRPSI